MSERDHLLAEITDNISRKDVIKARLVLTHLQHVDGTAREQVLGAFSTADPDFAVPVLAWFLTEHSDMALSHPRVREILATKILAMPELASRAIRDPSTPHRRICVSMAGELRLTSTVPDLLEALRKSTDTEEMQQIIDVLGDLGDDRGTDALGDVLCSHHRGLVISAISALGKIGTSTAMLRLGERMGSDSQLDLLALNVFAKVQDSISLENLNASMRSQFVHVRTCAKKNLIHIGSKAVPMLAENLCSGDPDVQIHSLNVLGDIGDPAAIAPIRKLLHSHPENPNVRFAAYEALGLLPLNREAFVLTRGLSDPVEHVCIAAARAIDRNLNGIMHAGIKNLALDRKEDAHRILRAVIQAQAANLFLSLVSEKKLQETARDLLSRAHPDIRVFFHGILRTHGHAELLTQLLTPAPECRARKRVCAVDDSRMILNIYKSTLHELGYDSLLFEFPARALEWMGAEKPDIVLTDLNMPDISGIELCRQIRARYGKTELPVIMVTTQNGFNDNEAAFAAGVNEILQKPFTRRALHEAIKRHLEQPAEKDR